MVIASRVQLKADKWISEFAHGRARWFTKSAQWCAGCRCESSEVCFQTVCFELETDLIAFKMWYEGLPVVAVATICTGRKLGRVA